MSRYPTPQYASFCVTAPPTDRHTYAQISAMWDLKAGIEVNSTLAYVHLGRF